MATIKRAVIGRLVEAYDAPANRDLSSLAGPDRFVTLQSGRAPRNLEHHVLTNTSHQTHVYARSSLSPLVALLILHHLLISSSSLHPITSFASTKQSIEKVKCGEADPSNLLRPERPATAICPVIATATGERTAVPLRQTHRLPNLPFLGPKQLVDNSCSPRQCAHRQHG